MGEQKYIRRILKALQEKKKKKWWGGDKTKPQAGNVEA